MNKRIQLLAEQAGFNPVNYMGSNSILFEKFVELIGRECLSLADNMRDDLDEDGEKQQALGAAWVGLAITRHFGIEE